MIKSLRNRFISIAMLSVTAVMLLLTIILNVANYVSTDSDLKQTLTLIYENAGTIPHSRFQLPDSADAPTPLENDDGNGDIAPAPPDGADDSQTPQAPPDDKVARREGTIHRGNAVLHAFFRPALHLRRHADTGKS